MTEIPAGYCQCGCGQQTSAAPCDRDGYKKGEPRRYVKGHRNPARGEGHGRWKGGLMRENGYLYAYAPDHPAATGKGYVMQHRLVAEAALGRALPDGAVVHHVNQDRADNRPANLVICPDRAYHRLIHVRLDALRACGNPDWRKCRFCGQYDEPGRLGSYGKAGSGHLECVRAYHRERMRQKRGSTP